MGGPALRPHRIVRQGVTTGVQEELERARDLPRPALEVSGTDEWDESHHQSRTCVNLALSLLGELELKLRSRPLRRWATESLNPASLRMLLE